LVIHPKNANPDLYVWISRLGQTDVNGLGIVHDRRGTGTFYQTNNNTNWDIIEGIDLAVKFRRAEFNQAQGTAYLGNRPMEKLFIWNNTINFDEHHGEVFISGDHFTLTGANCSPGVGDFAVGDTSKQNSAVVNVSGGLVCAGNTGYYKGEVLHFFSNTGTYKGDATASDIINGSGSLDYYVDGTTSLVHLGQAGGGGFVVGDAIICSSDWSKFGYINSFEAISQFNYSAFHFEPSALNFHLTSMSYTMNTTSSAGTTRTVVDVDPSTTQYFKTEQAVLSRTGELNKLAGANSNIVKVSMKTSSNAVSPLLDTTKTQTILLDTIINNDTTNETLPTHGALINKYITKTVTLAEGQDAEDMQVILSAYRPPGTDVKVWIKILNAFDSSPFADQHWVELYKDGNGDNTYSSIDDRNNFKEFTYKVPGWAYDRLTIANTSGTTLAKVNVGDTLLGLSSGFTATVSNVEGGTIYVMSDSGFAAGETANVSSGGTVYGNTIVTATGRTVALNATVGTTSNVIAYTTDTGVTYASYKYFAIKVGLLNDGINNAVYPRVGDLRAIALQK
jgi:ribosomal protein L31